MTKGEKESQKKYRIKHKVKIAEKKKNKERTKKGVIESIYYSQRTNSKKRNHEFPNYTRQELSEFILSSEKFHELYEKWILSNFDILLKPSIDRINVLEGYSFDNIQLMTWGENKNKGHEERILTHSKDKKHFENKANARFDFKSSCKAHKWNFEDFEEIFAEWHHYNDGTRKRYYFYKEKTRRD